MSLLVGPVVGPVVGPKVGPNGDVSAGVPVTWTVDATSGIAVPANATEWADFIAANGLSISVPSSLYLMQEASGNLADSIGALTLTSTSLTYQQAVAGWTRLGITVTDGSGGRAEATVGNGPNPATTSQTWIVFADLTSTPAGNRHLLHINTIAATGAFVLVNVTPVIGITCAAVTANGASNPVTGGVRPFALKYDRTNSAAVAYSDQDKVAGTYNAGVVDGGKGFGRGSSNDPAGAWLYGYMFSGAAAEISDATMKALLQAHGFTIPWS
jgi:hypothetical protein